MLLVLLLVGVALLFVAVTARREFLRESELPAGEVDVRHRMAACNHPLSTAYPHLHLWIPTEEYLCRSEPPGGRAGPDIIIRPVTTLRLRETQQFSDAA